MGAMERPTSALHLTRVTLSLRQLGADPRRFTSAPCTMAFVSLVPSEHSSGTKQARGVITKTGNAHLRRVLVEAAWPTSERRILDQLIIDITGNGAQRGDKSRVRKNKGFRPLVEFDRQLTKALLAARLRYWNLAHRRNHRPTTLLPAGF
jgi:hypothetical protein